MTKLPRKSGSLARLKRRGIKKALVFSLIPLGLLLLTSTVLISSLEKHDVVDTIRLDDRVHYPPIDFLKIEDGQYVIDEESMIRTAFPVKKAENAFRIIMTGGSFAMGCPYNTQSSAPENLRGGIPNWLQAELQARFPSVHFETINAAAAGQSSFRVKEIVRQLVRVDPDLLIVAAGNNEGNVPITGLNILLHQWNAYRALKKLFLRSPALHDRPELGHNKLVAEDYLAAFTANIMDLVEIAKKNKIGLILTTIPVNLKINRYKHIRKPKDEAFLEGIRLMESGDWHAAIRSFKKSELTPQKWYFVAQCHEKLEQFEAARRFYLKYVELSRGLISQNIYLRIIAEKNNVPLADLEKTAFDLSPHGITGNSLFLDVCHMNWQGYHLMSQEIIRALLDSKRIPAAPNEPLPKPTMEDLIERNGWLELISSPH